MFRKPAHSASGDGISIKLGMQHNDEDDMNRTEKMESPWRSAKMASSICENAGVRDPLYLFACHLEWHKNGNIGAYEELLAALDDPDENVRAIAEALLNRKSPRPQSIHESDEIW